MTKDCAFQYYCNGMIEDTGLITREEADTLLDRYKEHVIVSFLAGRDFELALWINMSYPGNYQETSIRIRQDNVVFENGVLYLKKRLWSY
jgi:hypothetical protein